MCEIYISVESDSFFSLFSLSLFPFFFFIFSKSNYRFIAEEIHQIFLFRRIRVLSCFSYITDNIRQVYYRKVQRL